MLFYRAPYLNLFTIVLAATLTITGCSPEDDNDDDTYTDPFPFSELPEDNTGSRARSITYVYDRTAVDATYPPKIDSSIIQFLYNTAGKVSRIRLTHNDIYVYDFSFLRNGSQLMGMQCKSWAKSPNPEVYEANLELEYNVSGKVSLMKVTFQDDSLNEVDSFIVKSTANRIDTVIDRRFAVGTNADKYAFTYNGTGDITQMDDIHTTGVFTVYEQIYKYTLSGSPAAFVLGEEAIFWNFFAKTVNVSGTTEFMLPAILFHSAKQPSKLVLQVSGFYTGTYNYQTEYYTTGRPKKMTANVITQSGAFYAREAYYYSYAQ